MIDWKLLCRRFEQSALEGVSTFFDKEELEILFDIYTENDQIELAGKVLDTAQQQHPDYIEFQYNRAYILYQNAQYKKAIKLIESFPENADPEHHYKVMLAFAHLYLHHYHIAQKLLEEIIVAGKAYDMETVLADAINEYTVTSHYDIALHFVATGLSLYPDNVDFKLAEISLLIYTTQFQQAEMACNAILQNHPNLIQVWFSLGYVYSLMEQFDNAIEPLQYAIALYHDNTAPTFTEQSIYYDSLGLMTTCYNYLGKYSETLAAIEENSINIETDTEFLPIYITAKQELDLWDELNTTLLSIVSKYPTNIAAWIGIAQYYERNDNLITLIEHLSAACRKNRNEQLLSMLGHYEFCISEYLASYRPLAVRHLREVLRMNTMNITARYDLACCYFVERKYRMALKELEHVYDWDSEFPQVNILLSMCYYATNNLYYFQHHLKLAEKQDCGARDFFLSIFPTAKPLLDTII